jgi:PKD repeat protein
LETRQTKLSFTIITLAVILSASLVFVGFTPNVSAQTSPSITINDGADYTNSTAITLALSSSNATQMRFSLDNTTWSDWETYATERNVTLPATDGNYTVFGEFLDSEDNLYTAESYIFLDATPPEVVPYVAWYSSDYRTVYFDASDCIDNVGIANFTWNFGDGNITSGVTVLHTYTEVGTYYASLSVIDLAGNNVTVTIPITIPDLTSTATPTVTPAPTAQPTSTVTSTPTAQPTATPAPSLDETTMILLLVAAIVVVGVVLLVVVLVFWKRWKTAPPA